MKNTLFHDGWTCRHLNEPGEETPVRIPDDAMLREQRTADALGGLKPIEEIKARIAAGWETL